MADVAKKMAQKADYWQKKCACQAAADVSSSTVPLPKRAVLRVRVRVPPVMSHQFCRKTASVFDGRLTRMVVPVFRYVISERSSILLRGHQ